MFVRAHDDGAGNWGAWTQLPLTVTNPLAPFAAPVPLDPIMAPLATPLTTPVTRGIARVAVTVTDQAHLVKVTTTRKGLVRARFVFAPHGVKIRGSKIIMEGHDKARHTVLSVQLRGNAKHGYQMRAISGHMHSAWLTLRNRRVVLEAAVVIGNRPTLKRTH